MKPVYLEQTLFSAFLTRGDTTPRLEVFGVDVIHPRYIITEELFDHLSDFSLGQRQVLLKSSASAFSKEDMTVALMRMSKYSFHHPTICPVEFNSFPTANKHCRWKASFPFLASGLPELLRGRRPSPWSPTTPRPKFLPLLSLELHQANLAQ